MAPGGGIAEILKSAVPFMNYLGLTNERIVSQGDLEFSKLPSAFRTSYREWTVPSLMQSFRHISSKIEAWWMRPSV